MNLDNIRTQQELIDLSTIMSLVSKLMKETVDYPERISDRLLGLQYLDSLQKSVKRKNPAPVRSFSDLDEAQEFFDFYDLRPMWCELSVAIGRIESGYWSCSPTSQLLNVTDRT